MPAPRGSAGLPQDSASSFDRLTRVVDAHEPGDEEGEDAVTEVLVDAPAEALDRPRGNPVPPIQQPAVGRCGHPAASRVEVTKIGEEHRQLDLGTTLCSLHSLQTCAAQARVLVPRAVADETDERTKRSGIRRVAQLAARVRRQVLEDSPDADKSRRAASVAEEDSSPSSIGSVYRIGQMRIRDHVLPLTDRPRNRDSDRTRSARTSWPYDGGSPARNVTRGGCHRPTPELDSRPARWPSAVPPSDCGLQCDKDPPHRRGAAIRCRLR